MPKVTTEHPIWPEFVKWHKEMYGVEPNLAIRDHAWMWNCFLRGYESAEKDEIKAFKDMGLVINQEGPQEEK